MATDQNPQQTNTSSNKQTVPGIPPQPPTPPSPRTSAPSRMPASPSGTPVVNIPPSSVSRQSGTSRVNQQTTPPPIARQNSAGTPRVPDASQDMYQEKVVSLSHFPQDIEDREALPKPPSPPASPPLRTPHAPPTQAQNPTIPSQRRAPAPPQVSPSKQLERLEQLRREDIRTMEKDITRIRENESNTQLQQVSGNAQQRPMPTQIPKAASISPVPAPPISPTPQRIPETKPQPPDPNPVGIPPKPQAPYQPQQHQTFPRPLERSSFKETFTAPQPAQTIIRDITETSSSSKKNFLRVLLIVILGFIFVTGALWGFWALQGKGLPLPPLGFLPFIGKESSTPSPTNSVPPVSAESPLASPSQSVASSPTATPTSNFISLLTETLHIKQTVALQFKNRADLQTTLSRFAAEAKGAGFLRLLFQKQPERTTLSAQEFFTTFNAVVPPDVQAQWDSNEFYFLYTFTRGTRFGIIIPIKDEGETLRAMRNWEQTIERDTQNLSFLWGAKGTGYASSFRSKAYLNNEIRFQTFSLNDSGIVYAVVGNYLIIASSYETVQATMNALLEQ